MPTFLHAPALADLSPTQAGVALPRLVRLDPRRKVPPTALGDAAGPVGVSREILEVAADPVNPAAPPALRSPRRTFGWLRDGAAVARYSLRFLPAVLRRHTFRAPAALPVLRMTTSLPRHRIEEWKRFFQSGEATTPPFTYFTPENSRLLFRMLGAFGPNFRHLLLVQHDLVAGPGADQWEPGAQYALEAYVEELRVWPRQRVTLACRSVVRRSGESAPVFETCDRFLVKEVPVEDCEALERRTEVLCGGRKDIPAPRLDPNAPNVRSHSLPVPLSAGIEFGLLSGDLNLVHAQVGLARWFGHRRPFAQGLYTSNRVVAALARLAGPMPRQVSVRFCRPLFLGQEARLLHSESAFEVLDAHGSRVAAGTFAA